MTLTCKCCGKPYTDLPWTDPDLGDVCYICLVDLQRVYLDLLQLLEAQEFTTLRTFCYLRHTNFKLNNRNKRKHEQ